MSFLSDETSVETSAPREAIEISTPAAVWRLASGSRSFTLDGKRYTAESAARGAVTVSPIGNAAEFELALPVSHAFAQRYLQPTPPRRVEVNVYRQQAGGDAQRIMTGVVTSCTVADHVAKFRVQPPVTEIATKELPTITVGRTCPHILYDVNCQIARTSFRVLTTVATVSGAVVTVTSMGIHPNQWAQYGELVHVPSGERMTISDQTGLVLTLQLPIFGMQSGDVVEVYAGCDHGIKTCEEKFSNKQNFGGSPHVPKGAKWFAWSGYPIFRNR